MPPNFSSTANEIWAVADLLRGDFKQSQYGRIILPFALLRRLECVLAPTKAAVLAKVPAVASMPVEAQEKLLLREAKHFFYNTSPMDLGKLGETDTARNLETYIQSFSPDAREIFEHFKFLDFVHLLDDANLLYLVIQRFAAWDLSPKAIDNYHMGLAFEELIRKFAESSNETAGEHFTPRDIVRLTTALVFIEDDDLLTMEGIVRSIYDPTGGTGGMISCGMEYVHDLNPHARLAPFGQELNPESYAICKADMLIKGQDVSKIRLGNTLSDDQLTGLFFDYMLSNPPFGVDWKKIQKAITGITRLFAAAKPHEPAIGDLPLRSKLFPTTAFGYRRITVERPLQLRFETQDSEKRAALAADKAWEKLDPDEQGLFLEVLDTLKETYLSRPAFTKDLKTALKSSHCSLSTAHLKLLQKHLAEHDDDAEICKDAKGNIEANPDLRDNENVPLGEDIFSYFAREVTPHVPLAWIDESKRDDKDGEIGNIGYEIPFNRHFYTYNPPRQLDAIDTELATVTGEIQDLLREVAGA